MIQLSQLAVCFLLFAFSELAFSEQLTMSDNTTNNSISHKKIKYEDLKFSYGDDRDDLVNSLISGCPFFKGDTLLYEYISEPLYDQDLLVKVPLPGNIKQNFLPKSKKISSLNKGIERSKPPTSPAFSTTVTLWPCLLKNSAENKPAIPPPTITYFLLIFIKP